MTVAVDVRMHGYARSDEHDRGRVERIASREFELQTKSFALIERVRRSVHVDDPHGHVVLDVVRAFDAHARYRVAHEMCQLFLKSCGHVSHTRTLSLSLSLLIFFVCLIFLGMSCFIQFLKHKQQQKPQSSNYKRYFCVSF